MKNKMPIPEMPSAAPCIWRRQQEQEKKKEEKAGRLRAVRLRAAAGAALAVEEDNRFSGDELLDIVRLYLF